MLQTATMSNCPPDHVLLERTGAGVAIPALRAGDALAHLKLLLCPPAAAPASEPA